MSLGMAATLGTVDALKVNAYAATGGSDLSFLEDGDANAGTNTLSDGEKGTDLPGVLDESDPAVGLAPAAETAPSTESAPGAETATAPKSAPVT